MKNAEESGISSLLAAFVSSVAEKDCLAEKNLSDFLRMGIFNHENGDRMDEREKKDFIDLKALKAKMCLTIEKVGDCFREWKQGKSENA